MELANGVQMSSQVDCRYFSDRVDAAHKLIESIPKELFENRDTIVIALSKGGVVIADIVAKELESEFDILLIESILAPKNPDLAIAKVSETQDVVIHTALTNSFDIEDELVYHEAKRVYDKKIISHLYKYRKGQHRKSVKDKAVILVDECIETDLTTLVAIKSMIASEAKNVYIATPILDEISYTNLIQISDGVYYVHKIRDYISIEYYYDELKTLEFEQIERILEKNE